MPEPIRINLSVGQQKNVSVATKYAKLKKELEKLEARNNPNDARRISQLRNEITKLEKENPQLKPENQSVDMQKIASLLQNTYKPKSLAQIKDSIFQVPKE